MRKVNLRNVDPAIDDPDASTWCQFSFQLCRHRLTNRYSPSHSEPSLAPGGCG
jgi:hypothetical protein